MKYQFVTLSTGQVVEAFYEGHEAQRQKTIFSGFDYKVLSNGNRVKKIAVVDSNGNKIRFFK